MACFLISDLHLNPGQPLLTQGFCDFLATTAAGAERLYILGDFFDAWIGDDDDSEFVAEVKAGLRTYSDAGTEVFVLRGNRDFLLGEGFARDTGCKLLDDETLVQLAGQPVLLMHGDSLCTGDTSYMAFRDMVRNPAWQAQILALPLAQRRVMAQELRAKSQSLNAVKAEDIMDVEPATVAQVMAAHQVQLLIHGHTHRPAVHETSLADRPASRWVLGDWHDHGWYIRADAALTLVQFAL